MSREPCPSHEQRSFGEEVELVHRLIAEGDRAHALHHCVGALALEPNLPHWKAPLEDLLSDGKLVARLDDGAFFGNHAARAFHLHLTGNLAEAIEIVGQIHAAVPHLGFHRWVGQWAEEAKARGVAIDPVPMLRTLMVSSSFGIGRIGLLPAEREAAEELVPIARIAMELAAHDPRVAMLASGVMRRANRPDEALAAAERAKASPEHYRIARGLALRAAKRFDEALAAFEEAFAASDDPVHLMETMRVLADAGRWTDALAVWAKYSRLREPDGENVLEHQFLAEAAARNAPPPTAPPLDRIRRRALGHGYLHPMTDATANGVRQFGHDEGLRAKGPVGAGTSTRGGKIRMTVSGPEAPSNRMCCALMLAGTPDPRLADYTNSGAPFDLAEEISQYSLWRIEDGVIVQALPSPSEEVSEWIESIALRELDGSISEATFETSTDFLDMWTLASARPLPGSRARDWVAATIHPRMPLARVASGPDWVLRWQVAALIGLAHSESGWKGTTKRDALLSLLHGPIDWPLAAAIRVAAEVALLETGATKEIRQTLIDLTYRLNAVDNVGMQRTLFAALDMIPYVPGEYLERLRARLTEQVTNEPSDEPAPPPAEKSVAAEPPSATKRPWWKFWGNS